MVVSRPRVWAWTIPAGIGGWLATGASLPATIPTCGWYVIESGVVSTRVWVDSLTVLVSLTVLALGWIIAYSMWARRREHGWWADVVLCVGFGATAWAIPYMGLAYTLGDHWSEGKPLEAIGPLGEGACGLDLNPIGAVLVIGGFVAIGSWLVWASVTREHVVVHPPAPHSD